MIVRILILGLVLTSPASVFGAEFLDLAWGSVVGMSADGSAMAVGARENANGDRFAAIWTAQDGITSLGIGDAWLRSISADGKIVAGSDSGFRPFNPLVHYVDDGEVPFNFPSEFDGGQIRDVSLNGSYIVGTLDNVDENGAWTDATAFRWSEENEFEFFDKPSDVRRQRAHRISRDGSTVLVEEQTFSDTDRFFVWSLANGQSGRIPVGSAEDLSSDGTTVVGSTTREEGRQAFRWTLDSGIVGLGYLPGDDRSAAFEVNTDGSLLVGHSGVSNPETGGIADIDGFIWDEVRGMRDLETALETEHGLIIPDSFVFAAGLVSDDGRTIAGNMRSSSRSANRIWLASLDRPIQWIPGDTDHDSDVDFADFLSLSSRFGMAGTWENGDFDLNGTVEFGDFLSLSENFGISPVASQHAVPEPSNAYVALPLLLIGIHRIRRNQKHIRLEQS